MIIFSKLLTHYQVSPKSIITITTYLKCHSVHQVSLFTKDKLGTFICIIKENFDLVSNKLEESVSNTPSQNDNTEQELKTNTPNNRSPVNLKFRQKIRKIISD